VLYGVAFGEGWVTKCGVDSTSGDCSARVEDSVLVDVCVAESNIDVEGSSNAVNGCGVVGREGMSIHHFRIRQPEDCGSVWPSCLLQVLQRRGCVAM
jgi:hypothetical protein